MSSIIEALKQIDTRGPKAPLSGCARGEAEVEGVNPRLFASESQFVEPSGYLLAPPELIAPAELQTTPEAIDALQFENVLQFVDSLARADAVAFIDVLKPIELTRFVNAAEYIPSQSETEAVADADDLANEEESTILLSREPRATTRAASAGNGASDKASSSVVDSLRLAHFDDLDDEPDLAPLAHLGAIQELLDEAVDEGRLHSRSAAIDRERAKSASPRAAANSGDSSQKSGAAQRTTLETSLPLEPTELAPYRLLADQVIAQTATSSCPVLAFTVPERLDEGAFSIVCLAKVLAEKGLGEVLLVDANAGRLFVSDQSGVLGSPGFGDVLMGKSQWSQVILPTDEINVALVPIGQTLFTPGYVPVSPRWEELRSRFRFVLVDTGPACEPENIWLVPRCDAAYLIVGLGETAREAALKAMAQFNHSGTRILGAIVANGLLPRGRRKGDRKNRVDRELAILSIGDPDEDEL